MEVQFDPDAIPLRCQQFSSPAGDVRMARRRNLTISPNGEVHAVALGVGPGLFGIEWDWPPAIPVPASERLPLRQGAAPPPAPTVQSGNASVHN